MPELELIVFGLYSLTNIAWILSTPYMRSEFTCIGIIRVDLVGSSDVELTKSPSGEGHLMTRPSFCTRGIITRLSLVYVKNFRQCSPVL